MKVNSVIQSVQTQQVQKKGKGAEPTAAPKTNDKVEISSEARNLQQSKGIENAAAQKLETVSDVRHDKVSEVREKIKDGFYDQENIASALADTLLKEFGI